MFVQIGQCGNQLGAALFAEMAISDFGFASYFSETAKGRAANAIALDTESKVIERLPFSGGDWRYRSRLAFNEKNGAGNNWANGFLTNRESRKAAICERARRCLEMSNASTAVVVHSLAGGTGAGFGSLAVETLRDEFPEIQLLCVMVAPCRAGEIALQHYNALFALSSCHANADGILIVENDVAINECRNFLSIQNPDISDINAALSATLLPALGTHSELPFASLQSALEFAVPLPTFKILTANVWPLSSDRARPFEGENWRPIFSKHFQTLSFGRGAHSRATPTRRCLSARLVAHSDARNAPSEEPSLVFPRALFSARTAFPLLATVRGRALRGYARAASLLANCQEHLSLFGETLARARALADQKAYFHHYLNAGMEESEIFAAIECVEYVNSLYANL